MTAEFAGTWTFDPSRTTKIKELLDILDSPEKLKEMGMQHTLVNKKTGEEWETNLLANGSSIYTEKWQLNKKRETYTIIETKSETTAYLDGNACVEEHTITTPKGNVKKLVTRTFVEGNEMKVNMECEGVVCQSIYVREA